MDSLITILSAVTPDRVWGIDVPNYFWFTGSSAAAFIISSFAHSLTSLKKQLFLSKFLPSQSHKS